MSTHFEGSGTGCVFDWVAERWLTSDDPSVPRKPGAKGSKLGAKKGYKLLAARVPHLARLLALHGERDAAFAAAMAECVALAGHEDARSSSRGATVAAHVGAAQSLVMLLAAAMLEARLDVRLEGKGEPSSEQIVERGASWGPELLGPLWPIWQRIVEPDAQLYDALGPVVQTLLAVELGVTELPDLYEALLLHTSLQVRRKLGVFHTPAPLARFMVRQLDDGLREAGLGGLREERTLGELGLSPSVGGTESMPACVLLEPAAGIGVLLRELVRYVAMGASTPDPQMMAGFLRRLRAYEIMPSAQVLSRLHLRCALVELGYDPELVRLASLHCGDFLAAVVHRAPLVRGVTAVIGNPPYARSSSNKSAGMRSMLACYREGLEGERNLQPLSDDYIKFMRAVEVALAPAPVAVANLVTNHSFLRGRLHRSMRRSLARSFPRIDVLDLHGNTKVRTSRGRDENVFGIAQGVSVVQAVRPVQPEGKRVTYRELRGLRREKLACLGEQRLPRPQPLGAQPAGKWAPCEPLPQEYAGFVPLDQLFQFYSVGGKPGDDGVLVGFEPEQLLEQLQLARGRLREASEQEVTEAGRRLSKRPLSRPFEPDGVIDYAYRPFDDRVAYYEPEIWTRPLKSLYARVDGRPILLTTRIVKDASFAHVFVTRRFPDVIALSPTSSVNCYAFPLATMDPRPLCEATGMRLSPDEAFAYVYAALHSDTYRNRYLGGLRDDFPRVPIMKEPALIASLVARGGRLLALHLGEAAPKVSGPRFVDGGDRRIRRQVPEDPTRLSAADDGLRLGLNESSRFEAVPKAAWSFRIGGYQVCRKWLLDRRRAGRDLSDHDVSRYCDVVARVQETVQLQRDIDALIERFGGFPGAVRGSE